MVGRSSRCTYWDQRCDTLVARGAEWGRGQGAVAAQQVWLVGLPTRRGGRLQHCSVSLLLHPWLVPSSGVAGIADDLIPPFCPVCWVFLFQPRLCHVSLNSFLHFRFDPLFFFSMVCPHLAFFSLCAPLSSSLHVPTTSGVFL